MGFDPANYPENWGAIRAVILSRAKNSDGIAQCECLGECGLHRFTPSVGEYSSAGSVSARAAFGVGKDGKPGIHSRRCVELNGRPALWAKGTIVLTTAHLCLDPKCANLDHLKAMCQRCHLRVDVELHKRHRRQRRERETGQQRLVPD